VQILSAFSGRPSGLPLPLPLSNSIILHSSLAAGLITINATETFVFINAGSPLTMTINYLPLGSKWTMGSATCVARLATSEWIVGETRPRTLTTSVLNDVTN
jgi:hypothetical protein